METLNVIIGILGLLAIVCVPIIIKSYFKKLGERIAEIGTAKELTTIQENVKNDFRKELDAYRKNLNSDFAREIEPLKAKLSKENIAYQIQFDYFHKERAKVIIDLYRKLQELHSAVYILVNPMKPKSFAYEDSIERIDKAMFEFNNTLIFNRLFFTEEFYDQMFEIFSFLRDKSIHYTSVYQQINGMQYNKENQGVYEEIRAVYKEVMDKLPPKLKIIEDQCRYILYREE